MGDWDDETSVTEDGHSLPVGRGDETTPSLIVLAGASLGEVFRLRSGSSVIGRTSESQIRLRDEGISRAHARVFVDDEAVTVEDLGSRNGTFINGLGLEGPVRLRAGDRVQLGHTSILKFTYHDALEDAFQHHMHASAIRDGLTRLYNRRYFRERLSSELRYAARHHGGLGLLLLDLDHFKVINDTHGHLTGDVVLTTVADTLARSLRGEDVAARYGGEELAVLLRGIPPASVRLTAERIRQLIASISVDSDAGKPVRVTVSIGLATFPESAASSPEGLIAVADAALYSAKQAGRNRVAG